MASRQLETQRILYIITYSRADTLKFPTKESFSLALIEAWKFYGIDILHWVVSIEAHANAGESGEDVNRYHFHMAVKLKKRARWLQVKKYLREKFGIEVKFGIVGSRVGAVVKALASHQCGPGSIPGLDVICGLSLLLVLYSAPRGFSPGTPVFPSPQKQTFPNSNSIRMQDLPENHFAVSGASWVNIMI